MEIKKTVDGKEYGFRFSALTLKKLSEKWDCEFSEVFDIIAKDVIFRIPDLYQAANEVYNEGEGMSEYEIDALIDKMDQGDFQEIYNCFEEEIPKMVDRYTKKKDENES